MVYFSVMRIFPVELLEGEKRMVGWVVGLGFGVLHGGSDLDHSSPRGKLGR